MSEEKQYTYWSKDVAENLNIADSTLRKWCRILEEKGHIFLRDDQDRRAFTEQDMILLRYFKELTQGKKIALDTASELVISRKNSQALQVVPHSDMAVQERYDSQHTSDILNFIEEQKAFNQALVKKLDQQQEYIEESLKRRDEQLMKAMRELQLPEQKTSWLEKLFKKRK